MKICIPSSAGGHLSEISSLKSLFEKNDIFYVTPRESRTVNLSKKNKVYFVEDPHRSPFKMLGLFIKAKRILKKEKPDIILSAGAGIAYPFCKIAKKLGIKVIFIESICRVKDLSLSGKLIYPLSYSFFVQWPELKKKYPKAIYAGRVF